jgi:hypothetical protein
VYNAHSAYSAHNEGPICSSKFQISDSIGTLLALDVQ